MFLNIYSSVKIFLIIFVILSNKANFNYSKAIISNKINKTELKFSLIEIIKGYNVENKLNEK